MWKLLKIIEINWIRMIFPLHTKYTHTHTQVAAHEPNMMDANNLPLVQYSQVYRKMSLLFCRWIFPLCTFQNQQFWCVHRHQAKHYPISSHDKWYRVNVKKIAQLLFRPHKTCGSKRTAKKREEKENKNLY